MIDDGIHELSGALTGRFPKELTIAKRGGVARCEHGLLLRELVGRVVEVLERATVTLEHSLQTLVGPPRDFENSTRALT